MAKRRLRKHFVLNVIRENGPLSRAEIAKVSGLNLPSVSSLVDELVTDELVMEEEARTAVRGRRPIPVSLRDNAACVLGIDIGKVSTTTMLANLSAKVLRTTERPTPHLTTPDEHAAWVVQVARETFEQSPDEVPPLCGMGVALAGLVPDVESGSPSGENGNVSHADSAGIATAVHTALRDAFGVEVLVENDARLMVPGWRWFGEKAKSQNFAVLNVGYGLGLGISLNGRLLSGAQGFAGELGHIPLGRPDVNCYCGGRGCLENTASGAALTAMARERGLKITDVGELADLARNGDTKALELFQEFAAALGRGVATVINLFNPEVIILTGKVSRASDLFLDEVKQSVREHALPAALARTQITVETPDVNLSLVGAVAVVLNQIFFSSRISFEEVI